MSPRCVCVAPFFIFILLLAIISDMTRADFESAGCSDEGCGIPCYLRAAEDECHYTSHDSCDGGGAQELDQQIWLLNNSLVRLQEKLIQKGIIPSGKTCHPLTVIDNGGVIYSDLLLSIGVIANFVCNPGFSLHGHGRYECSVDGVWIGNNSEPISQFPNCEASLITCEALVPIPYGHISYHIVDTTIIQPGDVVSYSCDTLYTLQGTEHRICLRNGTWSGEEPTCIAPPTEANKTSTSHHASKDHSNDVKISVGVLVPLVIAIFATAITIVIAILYIKRRRGGYLTLPEVHKKTVEDIDTNL